MSIHETPLNTAILIWHTSGNACCRNDLKKGGVMKWIETIMLRSAEEIPRDLLEDWTQNLNPKGKTGSLVEVKVYRNCSLNTDLNIQIRWESDIPPKGAPVGNPVGESSMGSRMHHIMKDFGLVCHMVWIEETFD